MALPDVALIVLDPIAQRIFTCDGNGRTISVLRQEVALAPDGVVFDPKRKHLYCSLMGNISNKEQSAYGYDGAIWRMNLDGSDPFPIVPAGKTRTPKQITADFDSGKLYWGDREGLRVMRCNLDGSELETVFSSGELPQDERDQSRWCVGIAVEPARRQVYFGLKGNPDAGQGKICRMSCDLPREETPRTRSDVKVLLENLPEPIDLELSHGSLFWTDRGNLKGGNSVSKVKLDDRGDLAGKTEIIAGNVGEAIGLVVCEDAGVVFSTSLTGELYRANLDGSSVRQIAKFGGLTGLARLS